MRESGINRRITQTAWSNGNLIYLVLIRRFANFTINTLAIVPINSLGTK